MLVLHKYNLHKGLTGVLHVFTNKVLQQPDYRVSYQYIKCWHQTEHRRVNTRMTAALHVMLSAWDW